MAKQDPEIAALRSIVRLLEELEPAAARRVLHFALDRFDWSRPSDESSSPVGPSQHAVDLGAQTEVVPVDTPPASSEN